MTEFTDTRRAGVLLHITSLPNGPADYRGNIGRDAHRFVDWMVRGGFKVWQVLPLGPLHSDRSPYMSLSAFAGNAELISMDSLSDDEAISNSWLGPRIRQMGEYSIEALTALLKKGEGEFHSLPGAAEFLEKNRYWLRGYAQFSTIRKVQQNNPWWEWPDALRNRDADAIKALIDTEQYTYRAIVIEQYLFDRQWNTLHDYARDQGIGLFGDIPLYVAHDSADVWAYPQFFQLDEQSQPTSVAGVPPDLFAEKGQVWNNPIFNWEALRADGFSWWLNRIRRQLDLMDLIRIDHFRGLEAHFSIPVGDEDATNGEWIKTPGAELLSTVRSVMGDLPLVAEDLGVITPEVDELRNAYQIPGMRIIQFGFDGSDDNPHLAENIGINAVAYSGTHDNDTVIAWFDSLHQEARDFIAGKLHMQEGEDILDAVVDAALACPAALTILPMQDILGLGTGNRMNTPGTVIKNWNWRMTAEQLSEGLANNFHQRLVAVNRST